MAVKPPKNAFGEEYSLANVFRHPLNRDNFKVHNVGPTVIPLDWNKHTLAIPEAERTVQEWGGNCNKLKAKRNKASITFQHQNFKRMLPRWEKIEMFPNLKFQTYEF